MIYLENISKRFKKLQVLDRVNGSFEKGQVISLLGPNGSGKTTLIKSILGMVRPDSGRIEVNGISVGTNPEYRALIGYMPQIGRYPDNMNIRQLFEMMQAMRKAEEAELDRELLNDFNIPAIYTKKMRTLSGGTRQKVSAALAFLFKPPCLILDEPTAGLDPLSAEILKEKIKRERNQGKLILITSHVLSDLEELTTHIMYLQEGKQLFFDRIESLLNNTGEERLGKAVARLMADASCL